MTIVLPPVEPDLPRLVDGADDQPDADCEELDFGDRDANVAGDGKSLVEHAPENIDDATGAMTCGSLYEHSLPLRRTEAVQQRWCLTSVSQYRQLELDVVKRSYLSARKTSVRPCPSSTAASSSSTTSRTIARRPRCTSPAWAGKSISLRTAPRDRKSTRLNSSHTVISYAVFC